MKIESIEPVCKRQAFGGGGSPSPRLCDICKEGPCSQVQGEDQWVYLTDEDHELRAEIDQIQLADNWWEAVDGFAGTTIGEALHLGIKAFRCKPEHTP